MDRLAIEGGAPLEGAITVSGAKNAMLPLMIASLLTAAPVRLHNAPPLADRRQLMHLLQRLGVAIDAEGESLQLDASRLNSAHAPYELVAKMRASFWVLGPLLARLGEAKVSLPGGCAIGTRPVNFYLDGLRQMGAQIELEDGYVRARAPRGLIGADIKLPHVSVGATHVLMMAACLAKGATRLQPAAREPEILALGEALCAMGAQLQGLGTDTLTIQGQSRLGGCTQTIIPDRVEAGAYALAAAQGGALMLRGAAQAGLGALAPLLVKMGAELEDTQEGLWVRRGATRNAPPRPRPLTIATAPWPGFPTDLQAPLMAVLVLADGVSEIRETIFENRFMHVQELVRMGAQIELAGDTARIRGVASLFGAPVMATDLRASMGLVLAALRARGRTVIHRIYHLDRGFAQLEQKLAACGARIQRLAA